MATTKPVLRAQPEHKGLWASITDPVKSLCRATDEAAQSIEALTRTAKKAALQFESEMDLEGEIALEQLTNRAKASGSKLPQFK